MLKLRCTGTTVRGIRTPIIKVGDNLAEIVVDSLIEASENEGFEFKDRDCGVAECGEKYAF